MHKLIFPVFMGLVLAVVGGAIAEKNMGAANITIPATKGNVAFPHQSHQTTLDDCNACHNLFPQKAGSIVKMKESGDLRRMQVMKQCLECHRELAKAGEKAGPVSCNDCHQ
ncbi:MAG: cytochrome c3 family protein [Thermodesulfobacteriota bacterium]|nr:cytochrome c3 family protein [Thermodesulfobacteriota bacterium]